MGFSLKKLLEGAAAQVNMNDGGKTFATVVRNQPVQSQPAKTPPPSYGSNPVKQAINRTRDVFDANTPQDRFKRQQAQKPVIDFTAQDMARQRLNGVKNVAGNYAKGFVESYNQVGTGLGTLLAQNSADVKNAQKAQNNLADQLHQQRMAAIKTAKNPNLNDVQRNRLNNYYNSLDRADVDLQNSRTQQSNDLYSKLDPKKNLAAIGSVGFDIATLGVGTGGTQAVKQAFKSGIKTGAKELGGQMVKTGSLGAVSGGLSPIVQKGDQATAKDILQGAGMGFATGAALPAVAPAVKFGGSKAVNTIKGLTKENLGAIAPRLKTNQAGFARSTEESPVLKKLGIVKDGEAMSVESKSAPVEKTATELPKNQAESVVPEQNLSQKSQQQSQLPQTETSPMTSKNTSEPIIPTNSVKSPEGFIPEAKKMAQGKEVKQETSKLIDSAKKSDVIPDEVIAGIDPTRSVKSNKESWNDAGQKLHLLGDDGALQYFHENHTDEANFVAWRLYEKRQARGDIEGASQLLAEMASRSIENGRATQAWNAMKRLDPKYIVQKLQTQVDNLMSGDNLSDRLKKRVDWSAEKQARITKLAGNLGNDTVLNRVAKATTPEQVGKITGVVDKKFLKALADEKNADRVKMLLSANFREEINSIIPSKAGDKVVAYWKAGLLSAPVTHVRNITGNLINVTANTVETPIAGVLDATLGRLLTPTKRTVSANSFVGMGRGLKQGASDFKDAVKYGITEDEATKFDYKTINWNKNNPIEQRVIKPFTDAIFRTLGAEDKIFKAPGVIHSLYNQAEAAAISAGKMGDAEWMANWVKNAPASVKEQALKEGKVWVFQKDTVVSDAMRGLKNAVKRNHPGWEKAVEGIQPFVNVPAAIGSELMTYTPAGLLRVTNKARKAVNKNLDISTRDIYRREAMKDLSKTTIGGGIITAGVAMGYAGQATGNMPPKNTKEYDEWMQENKQPNSIRIGNKWLNINSLGPQMALFNAAAQTGAQWRKAQDEGKPADLATNAVRFTGNVATNWFNASSLTGASNAQKALSDPVRYGQDYIARQATSFIPNFAKRWGAGIDQYARDPQSFKDAVLANIPIARTNTPIKVDSTGTPVVNNSYGALGLKSLFDPMNIATARDGGIAPISKQSTIQTGGMPTSETDRAARVKDMKNTLQTKLYDGRYKGKTNAQLEDLANYGDTDAQDLLNSFEAINKRFAKPEKPTPNLSSSAQNILNEEKKYTDTGKAAWGSRPTENKGAQKAISQLAGEELQVDNATAEKWAKYERDRVTGKINELDKVKAQRDILKSAYSSSLSPEEKKYFSYNDNDLLNALQNGNLKPDSLAKAMSVDAQLVSKGLITTSGFGKKVWNALGLAYPSVKGSSTRTSGRRTSGRRVSSKKLKTTKTISLDTFKKYKTRRSSTNASLRKLLGSAKV